MQMMRTTVRAIALVSALLMAAAAAVAQSAGGLLDLNAAPESEVARLPHMTPAIAKGLLEQRPFKNIVELNKFMINRGLAPEQTKELYQRAFVPINLNTGTREEFLLIPGVGTRMSAEFAEYRPWKSWAQFDKEIGKYVGQRETDRLKQYFFIPPN